MKRFSELLIREKIVRIIMMVSLISLLTGFTVVILFDILTFSNEMIDNTQLIARVVGDYSTADLAFDSKEDAERTLSGLSIVPNIDAAALYDEAGVLFATYSRNQVPAYFPPVRRETTYFSGGKLHLFNAITHRGTLYGTIYLRASMSPLMIKMLNYLLVMVVIAGAIIGLTFFVARRLQGRISDPILSLEGMAMDISRRGDYTVRVRKTGNDEIGLLTDAFNEMLSQIQSRKEELENTRIYLQNIIDSMPSILIGVDADGRITQWNNEAARMTGVTRDQAEGRPIYDVFPSLESHMDKITMALTDRSVQKAERIKHKLQNTMIWTDMMVYPLISNGILGAVIRIDDITARVRIEEMMIQTEKMMSVGGIAAGMAHEINNPLGGILLCAHNMLRRMSDSIEKNREAADELGIPLDKISQYMEKRGFTDMIHNIIELSERSSVIVANMLSFSRRSEARKVMTNLKEILNKSVELAANDYDLKKKYDFRHIQIIREYEENMPMVPCIPTEIEQVSLNLLKNAAQAMLDSQKPGERPAITIRLAKRQAAAMIEVEDNGPGMDENTMKRIFEPFFTTKEVGIGTGLGLSVSYFIITNNHRGTISVHSTPGRGARFTIEIPLEDGENEQQ